MLDSKMHISDVKHPKYASEIRGGEGDERKAQHEIYLYILDTCKST